LIFISISNIKKKDSQKILKKKKKKMVNDNILLMKGKNKIFKIMNFIKEKKFDEQKNVFKTFDDDQINIFLQICVYFIFLFFTL
jgi:hypothetical protein